MHKQALISRSRDQIPAVVSPSIVPDIELHAATSQQRTQCLELRVNLKNLRHVLNDLTPFFGPNCPASLFEVEGRVEIEAMRGSISTVKDWAQSKLDDRPLVLMVG